MENKNIIGVLRIMDDLKIKPNYSELSRAYGVDRHTVKKYHQNGSIPERKKAVRVSKWDKYFDEIQEIMNMGGVTKQAVFQSLKYKYGDEIGHWFNFEIRYDCFCVYYHMSSPPGNDIYYS